MLTNAMSPVTFVSTAILRRGEVWNHNNGINATPPKEATMSSANLQTPSPAPRAPTEATGWTGWVAFAAFVMMLSGTLTGIIGFLAVINNNWSMWNNNGAPYGSVYWWGWWSMFVGVVVFAIGAALLRGSMFARTVAVFVAAGSLISQFVTLNIAPLWSLTVITIDILVIWAVMVHGKEMQDV
jgi:hypothetical protein